MRGLSQAGVVVVVTPPIWLGVPVARPLGDAYIEARYCFDLCGDVWPKIEHYEWRNWAHRGLTLERTIPRDRKQSAMLAAEARAYSEQYPKVREWLRRFADRLQAEAEFSAERSAWLLRSA